MTAPAGRRLGALAVLTLALGVGTWALLRQQPPPPESTEPGPGGSDPSAASAVEVTFAGCEAVRRGPVCEVSSAGPLTLFVASADPPAVTDQSGRTLSAEVVATQGGTRLVVTPPPGAEALQVGTWELALAPPPAAPAPLVAARAAMDEHRYEDAASQLEHSLTTLPEAARGLALGLLGRVQLRRGQPDAAVPLFARSIAHHREHGLLSELTRDTFAYAHTLGSSWRFSDARQALEALEPDLAEYPEGAASAPFYRASISADTGDLREALRLLALTATRSEQLGLGMQASHARQLRALTFDHLSRSADGVALLEPLLETTADPCGRAILLNNLGWVQLRAARGDADQLTRARDRLAEAYRLQTGPCPRPRQAANTETNLALAELLLEHPEEAARHLAGSRALEQAPAVVQAWWLQLDGAIALLRGDAAAALTQYEELAARAEAGASPALAWRARVGRGRALEALDRPVEAIAAYREAESLLRDQSLRAPLGEGRDVFLSGHDESARLLVDLLLRQDEVVEAFAVARRARARLLAWLRRVDRLQRLSPGDRARWEAALTRYKRERAALEEDAAEDWQRPVDALVARRAARATQLDEMQGHLEAAFAVLAEGADADWQPPPARPGERVLAWFPVGDVDWVMFAAGPDGVHAHRMSRAEVMDDARLGARVEAALGADLASVARVRLLPFGAVQGLDLHALPVGGAPLVALAPVVYGLDLPPAGSAIQAGPALVVADPLGDLPATQEEARVVRAAVGDPGEVLESTAATAERVRAGLTHASLLHFAGHADHAGRDGAESALLLADGARLTVPDILALERAPARVYLSGCETGAVTREAAVAGLGLAQAFVALGAEQVVATTRPVPDTLSRSVAERVYAEPGRDWAEGLRRAQVALARGDAEVDWEAYRVYVP